ncbi:MAG: zinc-ribbon domain-containing protein [Alphaproteobacteria bacterium]|nr:zinc-ribbon domain-containing protein [Alphaproteobacteria bacterium]
MIITCQNCHTNYNVDASIIGAGKVVQCQNCSNSWHQNPVPAAPPVQPMAQPVYAAPPPPPVAQPAPPPPPVYPEPVPEPEPVAEPVEELPPEPEAMPEPMPEPLEDLEAEPEMEMESEEEPMAEGAPVEEAEADAELGGEGEGSGAEEDALSPEQLNEMFGEDTESDAFGSLDGSDDDGGIDDLDSIPDPDPIPEVFSSGGDSLDDDMESGGGKGKIIGIVAAVLILGLGAGLFFGRPYIIDLVPQAAGIYSMLDFGGGDIGEGLGIDNIKSQREVESGVDVLIVRGEITNTTEDEHMVPMIRVVLYDANGEEVQSTVAAPLKNRLPGGAKVGFSAKLPEPSDLARRLEVTFTDAKKK